MFEVKSGRYGDIYVAWESVLSRIYVYLGDRGAMRSEERGVTIHMGRSRAQLVAAGAAMTGLIMKKTPHWILLAGC